jgi:diguanylate cyclase (GGDEF)-like protein/PAS domain S-box-containing protein
VFDGEEQLRALLRNVSDTITVLDTDGTVLWQSGNPGGTLGMPDEYWRGRSGFEFIHPDDVEQMGVWLVELLSAPGTEVRGEYRIAAPGGEWNTVDATAVNLLHDPMIGGIVMTTRNINERKRHEERLQFLALHDALTGLPNRALLLDRLAHALDAMDRRAGTVAVLFCDLDRFKLVNDSLGHGPGDQVLVTFGERLGAVLRPGDTVGRFGGDEFIVLCEDVADEAEARAIAGRIDAALAEPFEIDGQAVVLTASIGVALATSSHDSADRLLRDADAAMYRAKERGRARTEIFDRTIHDRAVARLRVEGELRQALARDEIVAHYEPVVDLRTRKIVGVEALARWEHPTRGLLPPEDFLPIAEDSGLIVPLDVAVLHRALRDAATWIQPLFVSVNLSARSLVGGDVVAVIEDVLRDWPADRLTVELTEGVLLVDDEALQVTLGALRDLGVRIVVDDFGTGFSSLGYLHRFPVSAVKIDKSFVERLDVRDNDAALVAAVIGMADALGLETIGEGVESVRQRDALVSLGCRFAQGFLFSPPVGPRALHALLGDDVVG